MEQTITIILAVVIGFVVERVWDYLHRQVITVDYVMEKDYKPKPNLDSDKENDSEDGKEITQ